MVFKESISSEWSLRRVCKRAVICFRAAAGPVKKRPIPGMGPGVGPPPPQFVPVAAPISLYGPVAGSQGKNMYQPPPSDMISITGYNTNQPKYMFYEDTDESRPRNGGISNGK